MKIPDSRFIIDIVDYLTEKKEEERIEPPFEVGQIVPMKFRNENIPVLVTGISFDNPDMPFLFDIAVILRWTDGTDGGYIDIKGIALPRYVEDPYEINHESASIFKEGHPKTDNVDVFFKRKVRSKDNPIEKVIVKGIS